MWRKTFFLACAAILVLLATSFDVKAWYAYHYSYHSGGYGGGYHYGGYHYGSYGGGARYGYSRRW